MPLMQCIELCQMSHEWEGRRGESVCVCVCLWLCMCETPTFEQIDHIISLTLVWGI